MIIERKMIVNVYLNIYGNQVYRKLFELLNIIEDFHQKFICAVIEYSQKAFIKRRIKDGSVSK